MKYLGFSDLFQLVSSFLTVVLGILTALSKLKDDRGVWTIKAYWLIAGLVIFAAISVGLTFNQTYKTGLEREQSETNRIIDSINSQNNYKDLALRNEATLRVSNESLNKLTESIYKLNNLQERSSQIIDSLGVELQTQKAVLTHTQSIIQKNEVLIESQRVQMEDAERLVNPVYPFHLLVSVEISFDEPSVKKLLDSLFALREMYIADTTLKLENVKAIWTSNNKKELLELSILNYQDLFKNIRELFWPDKRYEIGFIADTTINHLEAPRISKSILALRTRFRKSDPDYPGRKKFSRLKIHFGDRKITIHTYFTDLSHIPTYGLKGKPFGMRDLLGSYMWFRLYGESDKYRVVAIQLYVGRGFRYPINIDLGYPKINSSKLGHLIHRFYRGEIYYEVGMIDNYNLYYYDEGTGSIGFDDPD